MHYPAFRGWWKAKGHSGSLLTQQGWRIEKTEHGWSLEAPDGTPCGVFESRLEARIAYRRVWLRGGAHPHRQESRLGVCPDSRTTLDGSKFKFGLPGVPKSERS